MTVALAGVVATLVLIGAVPAGLSRDAQGDTGPREVPAVVAAFEHEGYRQGDRARLVVDDPHRALTLQVLRSGPERVPTRRIIDLHGVPVTRERTVGGRPGRRVVTVPIGSWASGLYFVRLRAPDGRIGFAPFVVSPRRLGTSNVAVVLPTLTWQAYNLRDEDGDGTGDSWYVDRDRTTVRLGRPHLSRGVPYGLPYHLGFLNWLAWTKREVDYLSQLELERTLSPAALAEAYDLIVFSGHHEYVTKREYDLVEGYRDLGGNLMFLSANNFFYRVVRRGDTIVRTALWRTLGRPEAAIVGVQYVANQRRYGAWVVRRSSAAAWLFRGTGLRVGSRFGRGGVEIDQVAPSSPKSVEIVAEIANLFGPGRSAHMTYYRGRSGAQVFATGAFHLTRSVTSDPVVWRLLENLWTQMAR